SLNLPKTCVFLGYNVNVFIFVHIDADDDFQVPDWHWPTCQSGRWSGGNKINYSACNWYKSSVAMNHFIGGKSGGSIYYKPIQCPTGYIMTGTRMYGIGDGVDEEHVDAYCCPFN
ncbi:hypothetical protein ACTFXM_25760, partial [Escherichia coli]